MNIKRLIGIVLLAIGIATIFYAQVQKGRIEEEGKKANEQIQQGQSLFQGGNLFGQVIGSAVTGSMHGKAASEIQKYRNMVMWMTIGGIVVAVFGLGMAIFCGNKKN